MANGALWRVAGLLCLGFLPGCAVVQSQAVVPESPGGKSPPVPNGIPYFLPRRSFVATVTEPFNGGPPTITVTNGIAEPDLSKGYVLSQGTNLVADNEFNIGVSVNGLLKSSNSTVTVHIPRPGDVQAARLFRRRRWRGSGARVGWLGRRR